MSSSIWPKLLSVWKFIFVGCVKMTERKQWKNMYLIKSTLLRRIPEAHYLRKNRVV